MSYNDKRPSLGEVFNKNKHHKNNPLIDKVQSGIYKAITTGDPDPEGRGRLAAYIPKLAGNPDKPLYFQYASPFGGTNGISNYGFYAVPPDPGLTIMVFFANNGDLREGYWFAVAGGVPDIVSGGAVGKALADGTGQGEGVYADQPAAKSRIPDLATAQNLDGAAGASPANSTSGTMAIIGDKPLSNELLNFVKESSGFKESTQYTADQIFNGYGTKAKFDDEYITKDEAEKRLKDELLNKRDYVIRYGIEKGYVWNESQINALTSYAQSAGNIEQITGAGTLKNAEIASNLAKSVGGLFGGDNEKRRKQESKWFLSNSQGESTVGPAFSNHPRNINVSAQGLYTDPVRGQSTASPNRDASYNEPQAARVFGIKSPGQNALTIDDGSTDDEGNIHPSQIRLTTGSGASVILDGDNDFIYMINSKGTAWVEIGADGHVMTYAQGSISMRAEKDINLRADKDINIDAGNKINMRSVNDTTMNNKNYHLKSSGSNYTEAKGSAHTWVGTSMFVTTSGGVLHLNGPVAQQASEIPKKDMPDIQNLESTVAKQITVPIMPTHEPFIRPVMPTYTSGPIQEDPQSYQAQQTAMNQPQSKQTVDRTQPTGEGGGGDTGEVPQGLVEYSGSITVRNLPLQDELFTILEKSAQSTNIRVLITSGGQHPRGRRTGSDRHNDGYAADVQLFKDGQKLYITNPQHEPMIRQFFKSAKANGALSIGAGAGYMGGSTYHIDIAPGNTVPTNASRTWGAGGRYAYAPSWLKSLMG